MCTHVSVFSERERVCVCEGERESESENAVLNRNMYVTTEHSCGKSALYLHKYLIPSHHHKIPLLSARKNRFGEG